MNGMNDLNTALQSSDAATLKFDAVGDTHTGTITDVEIRQVRNFDTNLPETWDDGNPKQQIVVTIDTGNETEGRVFIKNWGDWRRNLVAAISQTGLDANAALAPGNTFTAWLSELRPNVKNPRLNDSKILSFKITARANVGDALAAPQAPQAPQAAPQAPQAAPQAPQAPQATPQAPQAAPASPLDQVAQLATQGLTDDQIAQAVGMDTAVVTALRANLSTHDDTPPF